MFNVINTYNIKEIVFDTQDMQELYIFFSTSVAEQPNHPSKLLSIAYAIDNILRTQKHNTIRYQINYLYDSLHPGHIDDINAIVSERDQEYHKKQLEKENKYQEKQHKYNTKCAEVILEYLGGETEIENTIESPLNKYIEDTKQNKLPKAIFKKNQK